MAKFHGIVHFIINDPKITGYTCNGPIYYSPMDPTIWTLGHPEDKIDTNIIIADLATGDTGDVYLSESAVFLEGVKIVLNILTPRYVSMTVATAGGPSKTMIRRRIRARGRIFQGASPRIARCQ